MSTFGDILGRAGRPNVGRGVSLPQDALRDPSPVTYQKFNGIDLSDSQLDADPASGQIGTMDIEVSRDDRMRRSPGILQLENMAARRMKWAFQQAHFDGTSEMVFIDPPYIGVKGTGGTIWTNVGLSGTSVYDWVATNYGQILLFSNAQGSGYARQPGSSSIETLSSMPAGRTILEAFGRVFVGSPNTGPSGSLDVLRIAWNAASQLYNDWVGTGIGSQLLLTELTEADRLVALRSIGYDLIAVLMRQNIWVGTPTGDANTPADFRSRIPGVGCVSERTARSMRYGVIFLSDDGVYVFDGNQATLISAQINPALLPLDYTQIQKYSATYDPTLKRYILSTPTETWVYEFPLVELQRPPRWYRRSARVDNVFSWVPPSGLPTVDLPSSVYFAKDGLLGTESRAAFSNFSTSLTPNWFGAYAQTQDIAQLIYTTGFDIEYRGSGKIRFWLQDSSGQKYIKATERTLFTSSKSIIKRFGIEPIVGMSGGMQLEIVSGDPEISRVVQWTLPAGPAVVP